jgi:hypothetical protein
MAVAVATISLLGYTSVASAQEAGDNIYKQAGIISNLSGGPPAIKYIPIRVPEVGKHYEVKVNFIKVETSAAAIDSYVDYLNEQAKARGEQPGSAKWDEIRSRLKEVVSKADFEILDPADHSLGRASDLGTTTFFRTVKFTAKSYEYRVKLKCTSGAGAYLLTLEWD